MNRNKKLLIIRYVSLIGLLIYMLITNNSNMLFYFPVILALLINNNLRIFYIKTDKKKYLSIILDLVISLFVSIMFKTYFALFIIGAIIDLFDDKNKKISYSLIGTIILMGLGSIIIYNKEYLVFSVVYLFISILYMSVVSEYYQGKNISDDYYYKLKKSEEQLKEANDELEEYAMSIEEITKLKERNRISREIHDSVGHALSTAIIQLSAMETIASKENSKLEDMTKNLREFINESFQDVKKAVNELKCDEYNDFEGITRIFDCIKNFEKMTGVKVNIRSSKAKWNLSVKQNQHLYRITQEILSNALRHGKATIINVIVNYTEDTFIISFKDNGQGTDNIEKTGNGLKNIETRVREINGIVEMKSKKSDGFFVKIVLQKEKEI